MYDRQIWIIRMDDLQFYILFNSISVVSGCLAGDNDKRAIAALGLSPEYHWNQIISKSVHRFSRRSRLKLFSIYILGGPFCSTERNGLSNFCKQSPKEHSCIIISKSMHWLRRISRLKVFLFLALAAILFHAAEQFEQF